MKRFWKATAIVITMAIPCVLSASTMAAGAVATTRDDCTSAWAVLMVSQGDSASRKEAITGVVQARKHWTVGSYKAGVSQKFALHTFDTRLKEGHTAYVAHCGHGATCNEVARQVLKAYPESGSPAVFCSVQAPQFLSNSQSF